MPAQHLINIDLAKVKIPVPGQNKSTTKVLAWGDPVELVEQKKDYVKVKFTVFTQQEDGSVKPEIVTGTIKATRSIKSSDILIEKKRSCVLKIDFVDVQ